MVLAFVVHSLSRHELRMPIHRLSKEFVAEIAQQVEPVTSLNLSNNAIRVVENLEVLGEHLETLSLANNAIETVSKGDFAGLNRLSKLDLSGNKLKSFGSAFEALTQLESLNLAKNLITDVQDLVGLVVLQNLRSLYIRGNPIASLFGIRERLIEALPQLQELDGVEITDSERRFVRLRMADRDANDPMNLLPSVACSGAANEDGDADGRLFSMQNELITLREERQAYKQQISGLEEQVKMYRSKYEDSTEQIDRLQAELESERTRWQIDRQRIVEDRARDVDELKRASSTQLKTSEDELRSAQQRIVELESELNRWRAYLHSGELPEPSTQPQRPSSLAEENESDVLRESLHRVEKELGIVREDLHAMQEEKQQLEIRLTAAQNIIKLHENALKTFDDEDEDGDIENTDPKTRKTMQLERVLTLWREKVYGLMCQLRMQECEFNRSSSIGSDRLHTLVEEKEKAESMVRILEEKVNDFSAQCVVANGQQKLWKRRFDEAEKTIAQLQKENHQMRNAWTAVISEIEGGPLSSRVLKTLSGHSNTLTMLSKRLHFANDRITVLASLITRLQRENHRLRSERQTSPESSERDVDTDLSDLRDVDLLQRELTSLRRERQFLMAQLSGDREAEKARMDGVSEQHRAEMAAVRQSWDEEVRVLKRSLEARTLQVETLEGDMSSKTATISSLQSRIRSLEVKLASAEEQHEKQRRELEADAIETDQELRLELRSVRGDYEERIRQKDREIAELKRAEQSLTIQLRNLERQQYQREVEEERRIDDINGQLRTQIQAKDDEIRRLRKERNALMHHHSAVPHLSGSRSSAVSSQPMTSTLHRTPPRRSLSAREGTEDSSHTAKSGTRSQAISDRLQSLSERTRRLLEDDAAVH